jgi:predicted outer membrane protein
VKRIVASLMFLLFIAVPGVANAQQQAPTLTPLDQDFLVKVRWANLWEIPAGQMAQERSASPKVQEAGRVMMSNHAELDVEVRRIAAIYNLKLPDEPTDAQKSWLTEMATASGSQFDSVWAMRLRSAHGIVFSLVANVRAETHDPEIRKFADAANTIVLRHMTLLEATGVIDFAQLYDPTPLTLKSDSDGIDMVVALTLVPLVVALTVFLLWMATGRGRRRGDTRRQTPDNDSGGGGGSSTGAHSRSKLFSDKEFAR